MEPLPCGRVSHSGNGIGRKTGACSNFSPSSEPVCTGVLGIGAKGARIGANPGEDSESAAANVLVGENAKIRLAKAQGGETDREGIEKSGITRVASPVLPDVIGVVEGNSPVVG